jgi:hypothetical protein
VTTGLRSLDDGRKGADGRLAQVERRAITSPAIA